MRNARLVLFWLLLAAEPAFAIDGAIEINQTCAAGDGCFAGDTAGFPVQISVPGSYVLTSDLELASANLSAISVNTDRVSIDLNGFSIKGITTCSGSPNNGTFSCENAGAGAGISAFARSLTVRNGRITGMGGRGIWAGHNSRIEDVRCSHNGGLALDIGWGSLVRGNSIRLNGGTAVGQEVIAGVRTVRSAVIDNTMDMVGGSAIDADASRIANNVISDVSGDAVISGTGVIVSNYIALATGFAVRGAASTGLGGNVFYSNNSFGAQFCGGVEISTNVGSRAATCP